MSKHSASNGPALILISAVIKKALLSSSGQQGKKIGVIGFEPTSDNQQHTENKALTENSIPVLATSLDKLLQKDPDLASVIKAWPELPEHIKAAIKTLVQSHSKGTR